MKLLIRDDANSVTEWAAKYVIKRINVSGDIFIFSTGKCLYFHHNRHIIMSSSTSRLDNNNFHRHHIDVKMFHERNVTYLIS